MSAKALRHVAMILDPIPPTSRLVLYEIASCHNAQTGECYPSPAFLSVKTGLHISNIRASVSALLEMGLIKPAPSGQGWAITGLDVEDDEPFPPDWTPKEATVARLVASFPNHEFNPSEAIDEFRSYAAAKRLACHPSRRDTLWFYNVAAYLRKHRHGPVTFTGRSGRGGIPSLRSFLSLPGPLPLSFLR